MGSPSSAEAEDAILFGEPAASSHWSAIEQQKIGREYEGEPSSADDHHELDQLLSEWLLTGQQENGDGGGDWQIAQLNACVYGVLESLSTFTARLILSALLQRLVYAFASSLHRTASNNHQTKLMTIADVAVSLLGGWLICVNAPTTSALFWQLLFHFSFTFSTRFSVFVTRPWISTGLAIFYIVAWNCLVSAFSIQSCSQRKCLKITRGCFSMRGGLMVAAMKSSSLAFDLHSSTAAGVKEGQDIEIKMPSLFAVLAYLMNPATVVFGPFTTFDQFLLGTRASTSLWRPSTGELGDFVHHTALALLFVLYSSCAGDYILYALLGALPSFVRGPLGLFLTAQSFRTSHYFVCYWSLATASLGGVLHRAATVTDEKKLDDKIGAKNPRQGEPSSPLLLFQTTRWTAVEFPRSMADVVSSWNIPMHHFLRRYIYRRAVHSLDSSPAAVLLTFGVSALLHGLNFQLSAVLLSLGFYAVVETHFRSNLARRFSLCVESRPCTDKNACPHMLKADHVLVRLIRLAFTLVNIFHLVYLGAPFTSASDGGDARGYTMAHTLGVWRQQFHFSSHAIALLTLLASLLPKLFDFLEF